jgi:hypothetical protein
MRNAHAGWGAVFVVTHLRIPADKSPRPEFIRSGAFLFHRRCIVGANSLPVGFRPMACRMYISSSCCMSPGAPGFACTTFEALSGNY